MKNSKLLYAIVVIVAAVIAVVGSVSATATKVVETVGNENVKLAEQYCDKKLYAKAVYYYDLAINDNDKAKLREAELDAISEGIKTGEFAQDDYSEYLKKYISNYYNDKKPYEMGLEYYFGLQEYDECVSLLNDANSYGIKSKIITDYNNRVERKYNLISSNYTTVTPFRTYNAAVSVDMQYGLVQDLGTFSINPTNKYTSPIFYVTEKEDESRFWAFVNNGTYSYLVNINGVRQGYLPNEVKSSTGVGDELLSCLINDRYTYYNIDGKKAFGDYAYASKFITDIAAVRNDDGSWQIINTKGDPVSSEKFDDVKLNGFDECVKNKYLFLKQQGSQVYTAYSYDGKTITKTDKQYDDIDLPPNGGEMIAYKSGDKWGYVDSELKPVIDPQFSNAKSFSNGFAGVETPDGWNFINKSGKTVLDLDDKFEDAGYFSVYSDENGNKSAYAFVKLNGLWSTMSLYKCD